MRIVRAVPYMRDIVGSVPGELMEGMHGTRIVRALLCMKDTVGGGMCSRWKRVLAIKIARVSSARNNCLE